MGLFTNRVGSPAPNKADMGSGRRLRSTLDATSFDRTVDAVMRTYNPPKSPDRPAAVPAGCFWTQPTAPPAFVICGNDSRDDFLLLAVWPSQYGVDAALFQAGSGIGPIDTPFIGQLKQADRSLTSVGSITAGSITLAAPPVPQYLPEEILQSAGLATTAQNIELICQRIASMFLVKAHQFISSKDRHAADAFVANNRPAPGYARQSLQAILHNLGAWDAQVLPYIQDLPYRVKSILLEREADGRFSWAGQ